MTDSLRPNIVLTGPAGAGKSTVGRRIATLTTREFVDLGAEMAAKWGNVHELPEDQRLQVERDLVADYAPKRNLVIATTPTTLLDQENIVSLLSTEVYHLTASTDELAQRVTADGLAMRPELAEADDLAEVIDRLRDERSEVYDKFPTIDTTDLSIEQAVDKLRSAGAAVEEVAMPGDTSAASLASPGGTDAQTRVFYLVIAIAAAIALVLLVMILSF